MKPKSILFYILFFMAAVFVFAFLLFPGKEVAAYLSQSLKSKNLQLRIDTVKPVFPFKLKFENTKFFIGQEIEGLGINQGTQIVPDSFTVSFSPVSIFKEEKKIQFESEFYQGSVNGRLRLNSMDPFSFSDAEALMAGVKISDFRYTTDLADITLACELNGEYKETESGDKKASGRGSLLIQHFSAKMKDSLFNRLSLPQVDFSEIKIDFIQDPKIVTIEQFAGKGPIINVKLKGQIEIVFPVQKSRLNLTGVIQPDSPYLAKFVNMTPLRSMVKNIKKEGIKFTIKGLLENPEIGI